MIFHFLFFSYFLLIFLFYIKMELLKSKNMLYALVGLVLIACVLVVMSMSSSNESGGGCGCAPPRRRRRRSYYEGLDDDPSREGYNSPSLIAMKKEGFDDEAREGFDDEAREGFDDEAREGFDDEAREGFDDEAREGFDDEAREGFDDEAREGFDDEAREGFDDEPTREGIMYVNPVKKEGFVPQPSPMTMKAELGWMQGRAVPKSMDVISPFINYG
jgi:hypothetical protein